MDCVCVSVCVVAFTVQCLAPSPAILPLVFTHSLENTPANSKQTTWVFYALIMADPSSSSSSYTHCLSRELMYNLFLFACFHTPHFLFFLPPSLFLNASICLSFFPFENCIILLMMNETRDTPMPLNRAKKKLTKKLNSLHVQTHSLVHTHTQTHLYVNFNFNSNWGRRKGRKRQQNQRRRLFSHSNIMHGNVDKRWMCAITTSTGNKYTQWVCDEYVCISL